MLVFSRDAALIFLLLPFIGVWSSRLMLLSHKWLYWWMMQKIMDLMMLMSLTVSFDLQMRWVGICCICGWFLSISSLSLHIAFEYCIERMGRWPWMNLFPNCQLLEWVSKFVLLLVCLGLFPFQFKECEALLMTF